MAASTPPVLPSIRRRSDALSLCCRRWVRARKLPLSPRTVSSGPSLVHFRLQSDAVRIQADPASGCRVRQYKSSLHPFPGFALRQSTALHPEGCRAAVHFLYMQNSIHDIGIVGIRRAFHLCGQHQRTACILHPDALQPVCRVQHRCHTHSSTQQDAERCLRAASKIAQHQTNGQQKMTANGTKSSVCGKKTHTNSTPSIPAQKTQSGRRIAA